jgi:putrescine aminotransferase
MTPTAASDSLLSNTGARRFAVSEEEAKAAWAADRAHLLHPWTNFATFKDRGSFIVSGARGVHVYDTSGRAYLDGMAGLWCVNLGYGREDLVEAIAEQARRLPYYTPFVDVGSLPAAQLAGEIARLAPGDLNHVFFTCGGSTANDTAVRLIHFYHSLRGKPEKQRILVQMDSYHGSTYLTGSMSGRHSARSPHLRFETEMVQTLRAPNTYRRPEGLDEAGFCDLLIAEMAERIETLGAETIGAFFAEPMMGAGGVIVAPRGYHARVQALCRANDILYVSDEVVTGFGRLGRFFASTELFGVEPDMIISAKGITSGYQPLGALIYSDRIQAVLDAAPEEVWFTNGYTYSGHPVVCAAGLATIRAMEAEDICGQVRKTGPIFERSLKTLLDIDIVGDVRGSHFMMCVEAVADQKTREVFPYKADVGHRIADHAHALGLIARSIGHLIVLSPPLIFMEEHIAQTTAMLREAILRTRADLRADGFLA